MLWHRPGGRDDHESLAEHRVVVLHFSHRLQSGAAGGATDKTHREPTAGHGTSPLTTAGHFAGIEVAGLTGDQRAMRGHVDAMHRNLMRDMHLPDAAARSTLRLPVLRCVRCRACNPRCGSTA